MFINRMVFCLLIFVIFNISAFAQNSRRDTMSIDCSHTTFSECINNLEEAGGYKISFNTNPIKDFVTMHQYNKTIEQNLEFILKEAGVNDYAFDFDDIKRTIKVSILNGTKGVVSEHNLPIPVLSKEESSFDNTIKGLNAFLEQKGVDVTLQKDETIELPNGKTMSIRQLENLNERSIVIPNQQDSPIFPELYKDTPLSFKDLKNYQKEANESVEKATEFILPNSESISKEQLKLLRERCDSVFSTQGAIALPKKSD